MAQQDRGTRKRIIAQSTSAMQTQADVAAPDVSEEATSRFPWTKKAIVAALALVVVVFTFTFLKINTVSVISAQDEGSLYYGARSLLETGSVRVVNPLAQEYASNVIGNVFTAYRSPDQYFYRAFPGSIILDAGLMAVGGDGLFWLSNTLFGSLAVLGVFLLTYKLTRSPLPAALAALLLATSPVFVHWGVTHFHNVPVLAFEVFALYFVLGRESLQKGELLAAGACMGAAIFLRSAEVFVAVMLLVIVVWRTRSVSRLAWTAAPIALFGIALVLVNFVLYGDPTFQPHVAPQYLAETGQEPGPGMFERYALYLLGAERSVGTADLLGLPGNYWFHIQYFVRSSFAFPLLIPILIGLIVGVARGWQEIRGVAAAFVAVLVVTVFFYGNKSDNYFGFDLDLVRTSFIRYLLLVYALLAVIAGVCANRMYGWFTSRDHAWLRFAGIRMGARGQLAAVAAFAGLIAATGAIGVVLSRDEERYGLDRLNLYRRAEIEEQTNIDAFVEPYGPEPLLLTGVSTRKLIDLAKYPNSVDYSVIARERWSAVLLPLVRRALEDRPVFVLTTTTQQEDRDLLDLLRQGGFGLRAWAIGYDSLFRVVNAYEDALQDYLSRPDSEAHAESLTANPSLLWETASSLPGWSPNGHVRLEPSEPGGTSGVLVHNSTQWGGIRQVIDARPLRGRTVTAVVTVGAIGSRPAHSAIVVLAREGGAAISAIHVLLESGETLITLEAELPEDIRMLRITVATGRDDDGDLAIQQVHLLPKTLDQIIEALEEPQNVRDPGAS